MPMKLNLGLSRKIGEANYGSRGASVNVELEVDSSLVNEPAKLQDRIRQLFGLVKVSLAEELNGGNGHAPSNAEQQPTNGHAPEPAQRSSNPPRPATQSQVKAIYAIARSKKLNVNQLLRERFRVAKPEDLGIKEASQFIDELKNAAESGG